MRRQSLPSRAVLRTAGALVAVMFGAVAAGAQTTPTFVPVTDAMLQNPDPADWLNWRRTLDGWGYSPLDQITRDNAHQLQLVWAFQTTEGLAQPTPLVHNGVMYLPSARNVVQAVDAVTGERIWEYQREFDDLVGDWTDNTRTRSIGIYDDKIYLATADAHIVALDARTGEVVWDQAVADNQLGYRYTSGPIVANGHVVAGMTGCERFKDDVCFISAHDAQTGEEVWRTSTIARPGEAGGDSWGDLPLRFRAGGDAWIPGSYDPDTNLTFWSTSQAKPWARVTRETEGDALYTNSVLALDADTGELAWYYQFTPGETHDLDDVFESVLIDHDGRRSLFKMGKLGILWEIDRITGEFVAAHDLGYQNVLDVNEQTGEVTYRPEMIPEAGVPLEFCPDFGGIRNWRASAYHPETHALYIPIHPTCVTGMFTELDDKTLGVPYYANSGWLSRGSTPHPASPDHRGLLIAMDITSGEILWRHPMPTAPRAATLTTAGGLVVSSDADRHFSIHDVTNGNIVFQTRLPASAQGFPITYAVDGRQYLAVPVGGGRANSIFTFALPERPGLTAYAPAVEPDEWVPPRTAWDAPDLQGIWDYQSQTPLERPAALSDRASFSEEEAARIEREALERNSVDRRDGGAARDLARAYGEIWYIRNPVPNTRTSLVIDPPDGRVPPLTPEAERLRDARQAYVRAENPPDSPASWTGLRTYARCLSRAMPRLPQGYNSGTLILQTPDWVVMEYEQLDTRFIPLDGGPHIHDGIRQWNGDSRGYWEGNTLVVETRNFTDKQVFRGLPKGNLHLTERYTRVAEDTINYEATLTDPTTWTRPWTYLLPWQKDDDYVIYEYACHEKNYAMTNILSGARAQEKATQETGR